MNKRFNHAQGTLSDNYSRHTKHTLISRSKNKFLFSAWALAAYVCSVILLSRNPQYSNISQYIGFGLAYIFVLEVLISRYNQLFLPKVLIVFLGFVLLMFTSSFWAVSQSPAITISLTFSQLLLFSIIAVNIIVARRSIMPVIIGMLTGISLAVLQAFLTFGLLPNLGSDFTRIGGVQGNANSYAILLIVGCLIAWLLAQKFPNKFVQILAIVLIFLFLYQVVFFTGSRKGYFAIFWIFWGYLLLKNLFSQNLSIRNLILGSILAIGFIILISFLATRIPLLESRLGAGLSDVTEVEGMRNYMMRYGIDLWLQKPIFGHGANQYRVLFWGRTYAHNNYVELLANLGIVGILLYYSFFALLIIRYVQFCRLGKLQAGSLAWLLVIVFLILIWDISMVSYYDKTIWMVFIILTSFACIGQDLWNPDISQIQSQRD